MKLLDRYILRTFVHHLLFALLASMVIFVTVDLIEHLDNFIDARVSWGVVLRYYYLYLPYIVYLTLPVAVLLATLFTVGGLVNRNEMSAMQSVGYSLWRILTLLLLFAVPLSAASLVFGETVVPAANHERQEIYRKEVRRKTGAASSSSGRLYLQVNPAEFLKIESYDAIAKKGLKANLQQFDGSRIVKRTEAKEILYRSGGWMLIGVQERTFTDPGVAIVLHDTLLRPDIPVTPDDLAKVSINPEEMNYVDLARLIERLKAGGILADKWIVDLAFKISQPFATAIIVLFGVPFAAFRRRGGLVMGFGLALLACFIYFGFVQVGKILGYHGDLGAQTAAWAGNAVFALLGFYLVARVPK